MVRGKNRIPYWIDRRLTGLAEPDYDATISFGLPFEPEDSQYGKYRIEALEELEFNLLWHHALGLEMEEAHLAQKTLHNFRVRLMEHDGGRLAFCETTDRMIEALGLRTGKQRVDSTHIMSNIAVLTRLGLFCETIRVFLLAVSREHPGLGEGIGDSLAQRYLKETAEATR